MRYVGLTLSWVFSILFGLLSLSMFLMGNTLQALVLLALVLLLLPPVRSFIYNRTGKALSPWVYALSIVALLAVFLLLSTNSTPQSVYTSPEVEARHMEIYDARLEQWPVPYETVMVDTSYGKVHVIVSGPEDAAHRPSCSMPRLCQPGRGSTISRS